MGNTMKPNLLITVHCKQTLLGKSLMALKIPYLLIRLGIMDRESVKILMLKTFCYRVGKGNWRRLASEYRATINA